MIQELFRDDLLYPELSYQVVGILFSVHRKLGNQLKEVHYQEAIRIALQNEKISFKEQFSIPIHYQGKRFGQLFADFVIDDKIIVEIKALPRLTPREYQQVSMYLNALNKELAILANFRPKQLIFKRILNSKFGHSVNSDIRNNNV